MSATLHEVGQGDVIVVSGRRVGEPGRMGEVLEVLGQEDHPHYSVRWEDGHQSILYPGASTSISRRHTDGHDAEETAAAPATELLVAMLKRAGMEFEVLPHRRTLTAAAEARVLGVQPQAVAKTLVARDEQDTYIRAVVPASARLDLAKLADAVSAEAVELVSEPDLVLAYPQFELGAVPPFGGPAGDRTVVDRRVAKHDHVVFDGGVHDTSLRMRADDLIETAEAQVADIASD